MASDASLATLPISIVVVGSLLTAPVMSLFMGRYGRRAGFLVARARGRRCRPRRYARAPLFVGSFELFMAGSVLLGVYQASARVLPLRRGRHGVRVLQAEGDLVGACRRAA